MVWPAYAPSSRTSMIDEFELKNKSYALKVEKCDPVIFHINRFFGIRYRNVGALPIMPDRLVLI